MSDTTTPPTNDPSAFDLKATLREVAEIAIPGGSRPLGVRGAPHLLRLSTKDGDRVIRRWEPTATAARIEFTAAALQLAANAGITEVPRIVPIGGQGDTHAINQKGRLYSAFTWQEGRPFSRYGYYRTPSGNTIDITMPQATPSDDVILAATRVLGRFHVATASLATDTRARKSSLRDFMNATQRQWTHDRRILGDKAAGSTEIRRWLRCGNRVMAVGIERMEAAVAVLEDTSTVVHGDLWPTHLLVSADAQQPELTGITGWSQVVVSSPLLDLAQLAVHVRGWSAAMAEQLIGAYHDVAPLTPEERRTLPVVAALDLVGRVARLLHLAYLDESMIGHEATAVLRGAIRTLLPSLETLTSVLSPPDPRKYQPARSGAASRGEKGGSRTGPFARRSGPPSTRSGRTGPADRSRPEKRRETPKGR